MWYIQLKADYSAFSENIDYLTGYNNQLDNQDSFTFSMMDNSHLGLRYDERVPSYMLDEFSEMIKTDSLFFECQSVPSRGPQGSMEWFSWPVITLMIATPYFAGFLKEAGSDHYKILKKGTHNLWRKLTNKNNNFKFAVMTVNGEIKTEYSMLFSIYAQTRNGMMVKFLLREDWSEIEYKAAINAFLNLIESYHLGHGQQSIDLDNEQNYWGTILISFDTQTDSLYVIDPNIKSDRKGTK